MGKRNWLFTTAAPLAILPTTALAQLAGNYPPPKVGSLVDERGVDIFSGRLVINDTQISIGDLKSGGLARIYYGNGLWDNLTGGINSDGSGRIVSIGRSSERFSLVGGSWVSDQKSGSTLTQAGVVYTYTAANGTIARFTTARASSIPTQANVARLYEIQYPSGELINITLKTVSVSESPSDPIIRGERIQSVTSSKGYQIKYLYAGNAYNNWSTLTKVIALNTAIESCSASADTCTPANTWPAVTFSAQSQNDAGAFTETDSLGRATVRAFSGISYPGGFAVSLGRDSSNRITSWSDGTQIWGYQYSSVGDEQVTTVTDPAGKTKIYKFSISLQALKSVTNELARTTTNDLEPGSGRILATTRPEGDKIRYTYDARGNVSVAATTSKDGAASLTSTALFPVSCDNTLTCNKPTSTTDARGKTTEYSYDTLHGGLLSVTGPADNSGVRPQTRYRYTRLASNGLPSASGIWMLTDISTCSAGTSCIGAATETVTRLGYTQGLILGSATVASGDNAVSSTTAITYDAVGNATAVDGPLAGSSDTTLIRYDAIRRRTAIVAPDPDGSGSRRSRMGRTTYDARGRVSLQEVGTSDAAGNDFSSFERFGFSYDDANRVVRRTSSAGGATNSVSHFAYDAVGRPICEVVRMDRSQWGNQTNACAPQTIGVEGPDRLTRTAFFDDGRIQSITTAGGTAAAARDEFTYSPNGKLVSLIDGRGNATSYTYDGFDRLLTTTYPGGSYEQLGYDNNGNVVSRRLRDGQNVAFQYDDLNRLIFKDVPVGSPHEYDVTYTYDLSGRLVRAQDGSGHFSALGYDALGRKTGEQSNWTSRTLQYDAAGQRTRLTWGDGFFVTYEYDTAGSMTRIRENGGLVLASFVYDSLGRRKSLTRANGTKTNYEYDNASRLTGLDHVMPGSTGWNVDWTFQYNAADQIASRTTSNDGYAFSDHYNIDRNYVTNSLNQYTSSGSTALGYDGRGNLITSGAQAYSYTSENRMATGPGNYAMTWDPLGRFHWISNGAPASWMQYDGSDLIEERNGTGVLRRYVFGPGADEPLVWYEGSGTGDRRYFHADERGSVVLVSNGAGAAIASPNRYDEFGIPQSPFTGRFGYTGQAWIPELGPIDIHRSQIMAAARWTKPVKWAVRRS